MPEPSDQTTSAETAGRRTFSTAFRGFDQGEVRAYLEVVAAEFAALRAKVEDLEAQLRDARAAPPPAPPSLDVATVTAAVGEETARVLQTAREAADEMRTRAAEAAEDVRSRAEEGAARALKEAHEEAARIRSAADTVLGERTAEAEEAAIKIRGDAEAHATQVRRDADQHAEMVVAKAVEQGRDMVSQAQAARERVLSDLARRRKVAAGQIEQLRAGRERLEGSLASARAELDRIMSDLRTSDEQARRAAESGAPPTRGDASEEPGAPPADEEPPATVAAGAEVQEGATAAGPVAPEDATAGTGAEAHPTGAPPLPPGSPAAEPAPPDAEAPAGLVAEAQTRATGDEVDAASLVEAGEKAARAAEEEEEEGLAVGVESGPDEPAEPAGDAEGVVEPAAGAGTGPEEPAVQAEPVAAGDVPAGGPGPAVVGDLPAGAGAVPAGVGAAAAAEATAGAAAGAPVDTAVAVAGDAAVVAEPPPLAPRPRYAHDRVPAAVLPEVVVGAPAVEPADGRVEALFARIRKDRARKVDEARAVLAVPGPPPATEPAAPPAPKRKRAAPPAHEARDPEGRQAEERSLEAPRSDADEAYLQRRDALLEPVLASVARALKRSVADDQNTVLDKMRTLRNGGLDALLGDERAQLAAFGDRVTAGLADAVRVGAQLAVGSEVPDLGAVPIAAPIAGRVAGDVVGPLRRRVGEVLEAAGGDRGPDTVDRVNSVYREARGRVERSAGDAVTEAVAAGFTAVLQPGTSVRWVVEDADGPCADCDDNALAGATPLGSPFPTGQPTPPAHPGCRCVLAQTPA